MEFLDYLRLVAKRWKAIAVITLLTVGVAFGSAAITTPLYRTHAAIFFSVADGDSFAEVAQGATYSQRQVVSFAELASSPLVIDPVIRDLKLNTGSDDLKKTISASIPTDTSIVNLSVTNPSPERAADIANALAKQLQVASFKLSPKHKNGEAMVQATVTTPAVVPEAPISPSLKINGVVGLALGLGLGLGFAVLRELMDNKIRHEQDVQGITDVPVVGQLGFERGIAPGRWLLLGTPMATRRSTEEFNKLRLNLQFVEFAHETRVITVLSAVPDEGKTNVAINLAISMAQSGKKVLLIDADMRKPSVATGFHIEGAVGLTSVLIGDVTFPEVAQPWGETSLDILPAGLLPPNPSDLLDSQVMNSLLTELRDQYDSIIIDAPPILPVSDGFILEQLSDGILLVVAAGSTSKDRFAKACQNLEKFDAHVLGVVINKMQAQMREDAYYSYEAAGSGAPTRSGTQKFAVTQHGKRKLVRVEPHGTSDSGDSQATSVEDADVPTR
ncbi:polysaccharide biosynthesis tyrosine autokinase [Arthrobacter sp.]|uniref:polysaccharide biosynthesis tyrosine autokinase n=1 Tax=Arthrobacter sp. TaxID=1667 RepID=UPI003A930116